MLWSINRKSTTTELYINNVLINDLANQTLSTTAYSDLGRSGQYTKGGHQEIIM
jgi:hypothetical protein